MTDAEKSIVYRRVVDLTHTIHPDIPVWPGDPPVEFHTAARLHDNGYFLRRFTMGEHTGTHLASPSTFYEDGPGPDDLPANSLILPASVIDVTDLVQQDSDYAISASDVANWERQYGLLETESIVLLNTGWSGRWGQPDRFINLGDDGLMHTPGFSVEAVRFLLEWRNVSGLGIDTHGIDAGTDTNLSAGRLALARPATVLECLNNLHELPPTGTTVVIGRLPLVGGSGSPVSALALVP